MGDTVNTYRIFIEASPEAIWRALTDSREATRYGYAAPAEIELKPGGAYRAKASAQMLEAGAPELMIEGEVLEVEEPRRLSLTWHPLFDEGIAAEPPTRITYELEPAAGGVTKLTLTHDVTDAPMVAGITTGEVVEAGGGFPWVLSDLKTYLESGQALPTQMGA